MIKTAVYEENGFISDISMTFHKPFTITFIFLINSGFNLKTTAIYKKIGCPTTKLSAMFAKFIS